MTFFACLYISILQVAAEAVHIGYIWAGNLLQPPLQHDSLWNCADKLHVGNWLFTARQLLQLKRLTDLTPCIYICYLELLEGDFDLFRTFVVGVPWESLQKGKGIQEAWVLLKKEVSKAREQTVPESHKASRRGRRPTWVNQELLLRLQEKKKKVYILEEGTAYLGQLQRSC